MAKHEEMAIITNVRFGMNNSHWCALWFDVNGEGWGAGQHLPVKEAVKLIQDNDITDIKQLEGKPCIVESEGLGGTVTFKRLVKIL